MSEMREVNEQIYKQTFAIITQTNFILNKLISSECTLEIFYVRWSGHLNCGKCHFSSNFPIGHGFIRSILMFSPYRACFIT